MMLTPFGALAAGFLAGTVSTLGYKFLTVWLPLGLWAEHGVTFLLSPHQAWSEDGKSHTSLIIHPFLQPVLESKFKVQDTCGVNNLHGMPGVLGALLGVLVAGLATHEVYGDG
jgi:ammonium transporter Rh